MTKKIKLILKCLTYVIIALMVVLAFLFSGMRIFGFQIYTVLSGSMEPEYHTGALIYVKPVDVQDIAVGDVITYKLSGETIATHRVVEVLSDNGSLSFRTKGDANEHNDPNPISSEKIIGSPVFTVPVLGYVAEYIQRPPGIFVALSVSAAAILAVILIDMFTGSKKSKKSSNKAE